MIRRGPRNQFLVPHTFHSLIITLRVGSQICDFILAQLKSPVGGGRPFPSPLHSDAASYS